MEILTLAIIMGTGTTFTLVRLIPTKYLLRYNLIIDVLFTIGLPMLFLGSFNGMALSCLTGVVLSIELALLKFITPKSKYS